MTEQEIDEVLKRFNEGMASPSDEQTIASLLESGHIRLEQLTALHELDRLLSSVEEPQPSSKLDARFSDWLEQQPGAVKSVRIVPWPQVTRIAAAVLLAAAGFAGGYFFRPAGNVDAVAEEVKSLKEMVVLSMLEKESASDRLQAVSMTSQGEQASAKVKLALIKTLNEDPNVNVRLAALDALRPYVKDSFVRQALVESIGLQDSPLVQMALAEFMVDIREKRSVPELEKIIRSNSLPPDAKQRITQSIKKIV